MPLQPECRRLKSKFAAGPFKTPNTDFSRNAIGITYKLVLPLEEEVLRRLPHPTAAAGPERLWRRSLKRFERDVRLAAYKSLLLIRHRNLRCVFCELEATIRQISNRNTGQNVGVKDSNRNRIFFGLQKRFDDSSRRVASRNGAGHLGDHNFV